MTNGRHPWLRHNLSTWVSKFMDSTVFCVVAFYGVIEVWPVIWGQFAVKILVALADTPLVYVVVGILRRKGLGPQLSTRA